MNHAVRGGLLLLALWSAARADFGPGDVFREYAWTGPWVNAANWQRVTDPEARNAGAKKFLPNPVNKVELTDLAEAVRAEVHIEQWGGHAGTSQKRIRLNGGPWIEIPESPLMGPQRPEAYQYLKQACAALPLAQLKAGTNTFEFTSGGQVVHDFGWGQWGVYGVTFRIYYDPARKPHAAGAVTAPAAGASVASPVALAADVKTAPGGAAVRQVDFIGFYDDFNWEGDGQWRRWHYTYRYGKIQNHLGSAAAPPWAARWDASWAPDQAEPMKVLARITDGSGLCCVTAAVEGVRLVRPGKSVRLYKPYDVPPAWQTRAGKTHSCKVDVPDDPSRAAAARIVLTTWCGDLCDELGINGSRLVQKVGKNHDYSADVVLAPLALIRRGTNTLYTKSATEHHGIEVLWPGMALLVQYDTDKP
ncbi:MAG: hypothetical protein FJ288_10695 [Planctomycetes bacterium]|nr:hypothetical protein [Planctomycetota bacterium]